MMPDQSTRLQAWADVLEESLEEVDSLARLIEQDLFATFPEQSGEKAEALLAIHIHQAVKREKGFIFR